MVQIRTMKPRLLAILIIILLFKVEAQSQNETKNWLFGTADNWVIISDAGAVGYSPPINTIWTAEIIQTAHSSTLSDSYGNLMLYTNGEYLYNNQYDVVSNISLIGSTQGQSLFLPVPDTNDEYFIVTTGHGSQTWIEFTKFRYLPSNSSVQFILDETPAPWAINKMAATYHANGKEIWTLTHEYGNNQFMAFKIDETNVDVNPVTTSIGSVQIDIPGTDLFSRVTWGEIKFSPGGNYVAMSSSGHDMVEVFKFNKETGILSDSISIPLINVKSIDFSSNGTMLYYAQHRKCQIEPCNPPIPVIDTFHVYQIDLLAGSDSAVNASAIAVSNGSQYLTNGNGCMIQLGSNQNIYCNMKGLEIAVINNPNLPGLNCNWSDTGVIWPSGYAGNKPFQVLPHFFTGYLDFNIVLDFERCHGDTCMFYTLTNQGFDSIRWEFTDPILGLISVPNQDTIYHSFSEPGEFDISLKRYRHGNLDEITKRQYVYPNINIDLPQDTSMCEGADLFLTVAVDYCEFAWVNHYTPDQVFYYPTDTVYNDTTYISDADLNDTEYWWPILLNHDEYCGTMDSTFVYIEPNPVNLGNDTSGLCTIDSFLIIADIPGANSYLWSTQDTTAAIYVQESGNYSVTVNNNGCQFPDSIEVTFFDPVDIVLPEDTILCLGDMITLSATSLNYDLGWTNLTDSTSIGLNTFTTDIPGLWTLVPINYPEYCGNLDSILITIQGDSLDLGNDTSGLCINNPISIDASLSGTTSYLWSTGETTPSITALESDTFYLTLTQNYCGPYTDDIIIAYDEPIPVDLDDFVLFCEGDSAKLDLGDFPYDYIWFPTDEISSTIYVDSAGWYGISAINSCGEYLDSTEVIEVYPPIVDLPADTTGCIGTPVSINVTWPYSSYEWLGGMTDSIMSFNLQGFYNVTVTNLCGSDSGEIELVLIPPPNPELGNDTVICLGDEIQLATMNQSPASYFWSQSDTTTTILVSQQGAYSVSLTNICGTFSDSIFVTTHENLFSFSQDSVGIDTLQSIALEAGSAYQSYLWSTMATTQSITVSNPGIYWLEVIDSLGCFGSDTIVVYRLINIEEKYAGQIKVYPNPVKDELVIEGRTENIHLYNALGQLVFTQNVLITHGVTLSHPVSVYEDTGAFSIDFSTYPKGIYLLNVVSNNNRVAFRIVKE